MIFENAIAYEPILIYAISIVLDITLRQNYNVKKAKRKEK